MKKYERIFWAELRSLTGTIGLEAAVSLMLYKAHADALEEWARRERTGE
jgi:hypothetical protein